MQPYASFGWCVYPEAVACMCACNSGAINGIIYDTRSTTVPPMQLGLHLHL